MDVINEALRPSLKEVEYYRRLVHSFNEAQSKGKAAINFENKMIDIAAYRRALAYLKRADAFTDFEPKKE